MENVNSEIYFKIFKEILYNSKLEKFERNKELLLSLMEEMESDKDYLLEKTKQIIRKELT